MPKKGRLIVIDGADGTGKATQVKLLLRRLKKEKILAVTLDFPQYKKNFFGKFIGECQVGKHGDFIGLSPYIASVIYDCDRWESRGKLESFLRRGSVVVLDRYVTANQIHQGGKIKDPKERKKFLRWLEKMDFEVFGLPRPDITLYLDVPFSESRRLLLQRESKTQKSYLGKRKLDQAEENALHQKNTRLYARGLVKGKNFAAINCLDEKGSLLSPAEIHAHIWKKIEKALH